MEYIILNNNLSCPVVGIGTFMLSPAEAQNSVREALKMGYSLVDTANAYVNERAVGRGIRSRKSRKTAEGLLRRSKDYPVSGWYKERKIRLLCSVLLQDPLPTRTKKQVQHWCNTFSGHSKTPEPA